MKINAFSLLILSSKGDYGFKTTFRDGLNIIRGNNSTGKSTLINTLIYSFGMEEIVGSKGPKILPYAVKDYFEDENKNKILIESSYVLLELENSKGKTVTLRRPIKSQDKSDKLIEIIDGPYLTNSNVNYRIQPTYIHDAGSAQEDKVGFFRFLEQFLLIDLPLVPSVNGGEIKLYLQTVFSAMLVEQKRGWTDYIANTPYFQIKNSRNKIIEFLLNLDVFDNDRLKNKLNSESQEINQSWESEKYKAKLLEQNYSINIEGIPTKPSIDFDQNLVNVTKGIEDEKKFLVEYISNHIKKIETLKNRIKSGRTGNTDAELTELDSTLNETSRLSSLYESLSTDIQLNSALKSEYLKSKIDIEDDLKKNKIAQKLKKLGAESNLEIAIDQCPTCHQVVDDSLILADTQIQPMSIEENVAYLDKQLKMMEKYINGVDDLIKKQNLQLLEVKNNLEKNKTTLIGLRRDISTSSTISEADVRTLVKLEDEIESLTKANAEIDIIKDRLSKLVFLAKENRKSRANLPTSYYSEVDLDKLKNFEKNFKALVKDFEYSSANISDIEVNFDTLLPYLSGIALRGIEKRKDNDADIKSDSSASDFVRLIWAYLISLFKTSKLKNGNHLGFILFDEPGQHSMGVTSMHELLSVLSSTTGLQSIVAASFDESDEIFALSVEGVNFHLIQTGDKLIQPIGNFE